MLSKYIYIIDSEYTLTSYELSASYRDDKHHVAGCRLVYLPSEILNIENNCNYYLHLPPTFPDSMMPPCVCVCVAPQE